MGTRKATQKPSEPPARRTQAARSAGTQRKILEAAAHVLIERGYAEATVQAICARAEVSQGGLFRHYPTTEALMVALAEHVATTILARYRRDFLRLEGRQDSLGLALALVQKACRSRANQAWYELMVAARTRPALRDALRPMMRRYYDDIEALARQLLPALAAQLGPGFRAVVETILCVFDGEALHRFVVASPRADAARLALLPALLAAAPAGGNSRSRAGRGSAR